MEVTFKGEPIELKGTPVKIGDVAPDATLMNLEGESIQLADILRDKVSILSVVPDITTRTCELQTQRFDELAQNKGYQFITISRNTIDEFKQWNKDHQLDVDAFSDANHEFGKAYGLNIELGEDELLTRTVIVVDGDGIIQYIEVVSEIADEPTYENAIAAADYDA